MLDGEGKRLCFNYIRFRACPNPKCAWSHNLKGLNLPEAQPVPDWLTKMIADPSKYHEKQVWSVVLKCATVSAVIGTKENPLALLDSGANEVVRPFEYWWWKKIKSG